MGGSSSTFTQKGIAAAKAGNRTLAMQFLKAALEQNPDDASAWLWMSSVVATVAEKRACLEKVLAIDPNNAAARRGLAILGPESVPPPPPAPEPIQSALPAVTAPAPSTPRRGRRAILIGLGVGVIGVTSLAVALLLNPGRSAPIAAPVTPAPSIVRPATWTPTPIPAATLTPTPRPAPTQLQPLVDEAIRVRELEPLQSIHYVLSAQFDIDLYLRNDVNSQAVVLANTFWNEMRALGLVDYGLEYDRQRIVDLTSQRIAGFYSPSDKTLYAVTQASRIEPGEYVVIVHEYVHALADMHFDLSRSLGAPRTTDADLAARALVEGDATLAENLTPWAYYKPDGWVQYGDALRAAAAAYRQRGISTAFLFIQSFPYVEGWRFVWTLREDSGWEAVNRAYANLPQSTAQILHPDRYLAGDDPPRQVTLPPIDAPGAGGFDLVVDQDTLGEFVLSVLLDDFIRDEERAARAADGWAGDAFRAWIDPSGDQVYTLLTAWVNMDEAREFIPPVAEMLSLRAGAAPPTDPDLDRIYFDGEDGEAFVSLNGDQVLIVWSARKGLRDRILEAFPDF